MPLTRRDAIGFGAAAAAAAVLPLRAARAAEAILTRPIPSSGERVPVVGIGTNRYRTGSEADIAPLAETLRTFAGLGGTLIDTAPAYGSSERVLGALIERLGLRERLFLATKVWSQGRADGIAQMQASLERLRTPRLDLVQVHSLNDTATQLASIREWKAAGRVRYAGVTTSSDHQYDEMLQVLGREPLDFVQVDYSIDNRSAESRILPLAIDRGVAVLVNLPFGRARLFDAVRGKALPPWAAEFDCASWAQFFLKYVISHPATTCAIPGTRRAEHARDNLAAARGRLPDAAMRSRMAQYFAAL